MTAIRTVRAGDRTYRVLVQSYRWEGKVKRKELYLGTNLPKNLDSLRRQLADDVWAETWYPLFDRIRAAYQTRKASLPPSVDQDELHDFVVRFTHDTNRIEGSTLDLEDTRRVIGGLSPSSTRPLNDVVEAQNHATVLTRLISRPEPVDLAHLLKWHREIFGATKRDLAGRIRDFSVRIGGSAHLPPSSLEVRPMLIELIRWTNRQPAKGSPVRVAAEFHARFEQIHPFGDGNGRIGRLAMNLLLARERFPMMNITFGRRRSYYRALEASDELGDPRPFVTWFFRNYARENRYLLPRG